MPLYHLSKIKAVFLRLNLKACAELATGQAGQALTDVKLEFYLADAVKTEPILISYLVRRAEFQIAMQPIWEGLAEHCWTDPQLQELEERLQQYDFIADLVQPLKFERTFGIREIEHLKKKGLSQLDDFFLLKKVISTTSINPRGIKRISIYWARLCHLVGMTKNG